MNQESLVPNNDEETTPEATNTLNPIASVQNSRSPNPDDPVPQTQRSVCEAGCTLIIDENDRNKCLEDCAKKYPA